MNRIVCIDTIALDANIYRDVWNDLQWAICGSVSRYAELLRVHLTVFMRSSESIEFGPVYAPLNMNIVKVLTGKKRISFAFAKLEFVKKPSEIIQISFGSSCMAEDL